MVALTAKDMDGTTALIRSRNADGGWGPWYPTSRVDTGRNDHVSIDRTGTEPIYVGLTKAVQVLLTHKASGTVPPGVTPARSDDPELIGSPDLSAVLIDPGRVAVDAALSTVAAPLPGGGPKVITRAEWGADPALLCDKPTYDDGLGGITVHHTDGRNDYTQAESAGIVRAIYAYHAKTLHWCAYRIQRAGRQVRPDLRGPRRRAGQTGRGRARGRLQREHLGRGADGRLPNRRLPAMRRSRRSGSSSAGAPRMAGLDPQGTTTMYSEGTQYSKFNQGQAVKLPIVFAHRDVGRTTCPGDAAYAMMDRIRTIAAQTAGAVDTGTGTGTGTDTKATVPSDNSAGTT